MLRNVFGLKKEEVTLHDEEFHDLCCSSKCYSVNKIMDEMGGACDVFLRRKVHAGFLCGNLKKMEHLENVS